MSIVRFLQFIAVFVLLSTSPASAAENLLSLSISGPIGSVKLGEQIEISVTVTNISATPVHGDYASSENGGELDFTLTVLDSRGESPAHTDYGKMVFNDADATSAIHYRAYPPLTLDPGDVFERNIEVTRIFNINKVGMYTISVTMNDPRGIGFKISEDQEMLKSNIIRLNVVR